MQRTAPRDGCTAVSASRVAIADGMKRNRRQAGQGASSSFSWIIPSILHESGANDVGLTTSPRRSMVASLDPRRLIRGVVDGLPSLKIMDVDPLRREADCTARLQKIQESPSKTSAAALVETGNDADASHTARLFG
ncbi:hypothetical protein C8R46DRAFT_1209729 [Mycena filopes]|nr:hypothetical protein C8R46DRAFT_1209729 [Mycena filopes]